MLSTYPHQANEYLTYLFQYHQIKYLLPAHINLSTLQNRLDADMCSAFGAILYQLSNNINTIKLTNIQPKLEGILAKNGFLSYYGDKRISDNWNTTIHYRRFDIKDDRYFADYIDNELLYRSEIPKMSDGLRKEFQKNIFEIFSNAVLHSDTKLGIYSCGQYFPTRQKINFSITDLGIGMQQNIKNNVGLAFDPAEAIKWATSDSNTTKNGKIPGGLGLKLLTNFIDLNDGSIQIVSDSGYWKREKKRISIALLKHPFPGTVVNIEINTADLASYRLSSELTAADIF